MGIAREELLTRIIQVVADRGFVDRSLRDIAADAGTSHRMVLYHFGSREGLISAIVDSIEASQRALLQEMATTCDTAAELVMALWRQVSSEEMRPFVRLFFESLAATAGTEAGDRLTASWLEVAEGVTPLVGEEFDPVELRLGVAVSRGLLIDVLASGDAGPATVALQRFVEMWQGHS